ncbi:MAG: bifunctional metallophosphatase/5'-nucleotidase [Candidatus Rifleibacteriota bacterium]
MNSKLGKIFLVLSLILLAAVVLRLAGPEETKHYHLILTGVSKGRLHPYRARFKPHKGQLVGGAAGLSALIKNRVASFGRDPYNLVSVGSELSGTADAYFTRGAAIVSALNGIGVEAMLVGNIEFTFGQKRLSELSEQAEFPFLSSNVTETGPGQIPAYLTPEVILYPGQSIKVGFVGLTPPQTPDLTFAPNVVGLEFAKVETALENRILSLRKAGVDIIVLLTLLNSKKINSRQWKSIVNVRPDVCIMLDYEIEAPRVVRKDGIIIKTISGYNKTKEIDTLDLALRGNPAKIVAFSGSRHVVNHAELIPDKEVAEIVEETTRKVRELKKEKIAEFARDYQRKYYREGPIGNMVADAMKAETGAEVALQNAGGIQNNISSGTFTVGDLFNVLPFDNQLVTMQISGSALLEILSQSASLYRGVMQVSGMSYAFANREEDDYELKWAKINGEPVVATRTYSICTNSFLASGGDNFLGFKQGRNLEYGRIQRDVVKDYLAQFQDEWPVELMVEDRIKIVD